MAFRPQSNRSIATVARCIAALGACLVLLQACSSSDGAGSATTDPSALMPGDVPEITADVVELAPDDFAEPSGSDIDVYNTLIGMGDFSRLIALVDRAGLTNALTAENNVTFFAPTDAAFISLEAVIGEGVVDTFSVAELQDRLQYHLVQTGALNAVALASFDGRALEMANELPAAISVNSEGSVMINGATVTTENLPASNGFIHVIDAVLTPPARVSDPNENIPPPTDIDIATTLLQVTDYSILLNLIETGGLTDALQEDNNGEGWTLFAPSDTAFENGNQDVFSLDAPGAAQLVGLHLFSGRLASADIQPGELTMSQGVVDVIVTDDGFTVGGATIVGRDRVVGNGIIHFVDTPLTPAGL